MTSQSKTSLGLPPFFASCIVKHREAMKRTLRSGCQITSGFATSEPSLFYRDLWDFIVENDLTGITIRQALFMAPHRICLGDAPSAKGVLEGIRDLIPELLAKLPQPIASLSSLITEAASKADKMSKKLVALYRLMEHYKELERRRIHFITPFMGTTLSVGIPDHPVFRAAFPEFAGRNTTRMGITTFHPLHFADAACSLASGPDSQHEDGVTVMVLTPPDERGFLSHGPTNAVNPEILEMLADHGRSKLILYINSTYPFTEGWPDAPNTIHIDRLKPLAEAGKLFVVLDDTPVPTSPKGSVTSPSITEQAIARHLVNHIEMNPELTHGRAIQVGIGRTGVQAMRLLQDSSWSGRLYTEMLEPYTLELFESGKIKGSHFVEKNGQRVQLDGKMVCTFTMSEKGTDFYRKLDHNPALVLASASRVVVPEAFYHGLGINNCLGIDFHGHVNASGRGRNHHSGMGGLANIVRGLTRGGVAYFCMKSTHRNEEGERRSSIFPYLPRGTPISLVGPDLLGFREGGRVFLITEHGVADLTGKNQARYIRELIRVAHPDFRPWLKKAAFREFRVAF